MIAVRTIAVGLNGMPLAGHCAAGELAAMTAER
jgi:hypothetical protein